MRRMLSSHADLPSPIKLAAQGFMSLTEKGLVVGRDPNIVPDIVEFYGPGKIDEFWRYADTEDLSGQRIMSRNGMGDPLMFIVAMGFHNDERQPFARSLSGGLSKGIVAFVEVAPAEIRQVTESAAERYAEKDSRALDLLISSPEFAAFHDEIMRRAKTELS